MMKLKLNWVLFFFALVAVAGVRAYEVLNFPAFAETSQLVCASIGLGFAGILIFMTFLSRNASVPVRFTKSVFTGSVGVFSAVAVLGLSLSQMRDYIFSAREGALLVTFFSGVFAAVALILMSISSMRGKNIFGDAKLVAIFPTIWAAMRIFLLFLVYNKDSLPFYRLVDELAVIFLALFLFATAKLFAEQPNKKPGKWLSNFGMCTAIFVAIYTTGVMVSSHMHAAQVAMTQRFSCVADLLLALYALLLISSLAPKPEEAATLVEDLPENVNENPEEADAEGISGDSQGTEKIPAETAECEDPLAQVDRLLAQLDMKDLAVDEGKAEGVSQEK